MRLHFSQCFHCVKTDNVHKTRFWREIPRFSAFNVVFAENTFERGEMLVLALVSLLLNNSMCLNAFQSFYFVKLDSVQKTRFSAKKRVSAPLMSFLLNNLSKRRERLVLALVSITLQISMPLHVSQCFHCDKNDNV